MARVKIKFPEQNPLYNCIIPVRISDINYGNHLGNDSVLSIMHEARMQMLHSWGFTELEAGGTGLIMADVMIAFRNEAYYSEGIQVVIFAEEVTEKSFDLLYILSTIRSGAVVKIAEGKTGMVAFDYRTKKIVPMAKDLKSRLQTMEI
ncbi:MAG: thioesterase [Chitinophagaceae bacterium]|nr:MAG: thioesterase [Chitinophagaceae bacterium]